MTYLGYHIPRIIRKSNNIPRLIGGLHNILNKNNKLNCYIGQGYNDSIKPPLINNTFLKNPKWYTPYTPYQAEISQGRLEMLNNYQNMVCSLTNMDLSNASLLDECNAACEASNMAFHYYKGKKKNLLVHIGLHPQVINSLKLKTKCSGTRLTIFNSIEELSESQIKDSYALMIQNPTTEGELLKLEQYDMNDIVKICGSDPLSLFLVKPPGDFNFDICYGSVNRFGLGLSYGGPHAGFLSCKKDFVRYIPGRIVTEAEDKYGITGLRLGLQSREQHIKKKNALSNICTAQSLPAMMSVAYTMYHGKEGMIQMAKEINDTAFIYSNQTDDCLKLKHTNFFDTITFEATDCYVKNTLIRDLIQNSLEVSNNNNNITLSFDEVNKDCDKIMNLFDLDLNTNNNNNTIPKEYKRNSDFLNDNIYSGLSELELTRYFDNLANKDYSLVNGMIPLGSCTMKHTTPWSMSLLDNPNLNIHPYTNAYNTVGYDEMFEDISNRLFDLIGLPIWFYQSQSGAMGELSGLYTINNYFNGERKKILIPDNAHGTNFASASLAGFNIETVITKEGEMDINCIKELIEKYGDDIAGIMITYPSTFGFFDENIKEVINILKENKSKIYLDGANMNAMVGVKKLSDLNIDVCHLNLHKTFSIPHGGGGPGMGPIGVTKELEKYLPKDPLKGECISGHKYGSGALCSITWAYLNLLGNDIGKCTEKAIENSNYMKNELKDDFDILFTKDKECTHEFLINTNEFYKKGYTDNLISKRLMDYGFHAPTMSWPVNNVLMIEPTESEPKEEMDRFIKAMKQIKMEMDNYNVEESPLYNAPHTHRDILNWPYPYSIEEGCYPMGFINNKYWPTINKLDEATSDRKLLKR
jgi:glycine dehydrogenase